MPTYSGTCNCAAKNLFSAGFESLLVKKFLREKETGEGEGGFSNRRRYDIKYCSHRVQKRMGIFIRVVVVAGNIWHIFAKILFLILCSFVRI